MRVKELKEFLKEADENSEIVSPFVVVSDRTVQGFTPVNGFRYIKAVDRGSYFIESENGEKIVCIN